MGSVWAATHTVTRREVAIKFLKESMQHKSDVRQRFLREARTASALRHPNVVEVLDVFDLEDGSPVMVMELLKGETLGHKLARDERLSAEETAALMIPVVAAVSSAHALGIVHRDLKPENVFLHGNGGTGVKVLDFGIAKLAAEHYLEAGQSVLVTEAGAILGTPCYMAPEQLKGDGVDHHADIWSLGVILYECLSGTRPVEGRNLTEVITRLMTGAITPLERLAPELPHELTAIVQQMLSRDVKRRPHDLNELSKVLSRYTHVRAAGVVIRESSPPSDRGARIEPTRISGVDPVRAQGPTAQSAPALDIDTRPANSSPTRRLLSRANVLGALALVLIAFVAAILSSRASSKAPESAAHPAAAPAEIVSRTTANPGEPALARPQAVVSPSLEPVQPAPAPTSRAREQAMKGSAKSTPRAAPSPTLESSSRPSPSGNSELSEKVLFPGRK
jgi:serine/threonine protein kinase